MLLDGSRIAKTIESEIKYDVDRYVATTGRRPKLSAVLTTNDPASQIYIGRKRKACERVGIDFEFHHLDDQPERSLLGMIYGLNDRVDVDGIMVQLPLSPGFNRNKVFDAIDSAKDVDCFNPINVGLVLQGRPRFVPPTPHAIREILTRHGIGLDGKKVVIINRSDIVGKPLQTMLVQDKGDEANATVTLCHDRTPRQTLIDSCLRADIIVVAVGIPGFITAGMFKEGAVLVDVGVNRLPSGKVVGDVDFDTSAPLCSAISPVPGGVGPITVCMLLRNVVQSALATR